MQNRHIFALSLVAAVVLAGCTALPGGGGDTDETEQRYRITQEDGLTISFQSLQPNYFEDSQIVLDFSAQNTGQSVAENVNAKLYGASFLAGKSLSLSQTQLTGVDQAARQPGGITTATYQENNPVDLRQGETRSFPAGVRVAYDYNTSASAAFRIVRRADFGGTSELVTTDNTAAPVKAKIQVQSPKPVSSPSGDSINISIPIKVQNVGGGSVVKGISGDRGEVEMDVSFPLASSGTAKITECGASSGSTATFSFPRGQTARQVVCTAEISSDVFDTQLTIDATLEYTYFETSETSFQIEGLAGDQSG